MGAAVVVYLKVSMVLVKDLKYSPDSVSSGDLLAVDLACGTI